MAKMQREEWEEGAGVVVNARRHLPRLAAAYFAEVRAALAENNSPRELHAVRLATKRLRYTLELFRPCYGSGLETRLEMLKRLQTLLGEINDGVAAWDRLAPLMNDGPQRRRMEAFLKQRTAARVRQFRKHWSTAFDAPGQERRWTAYLAHDARYPGSSDRTGPHHAFGIEQNIRTFQELLPDARRLGVGIMIENLPGDYNSAQQLGELLDPLPELGLHLDIGHANLNVPHNTTGEILNAYGTRLRHVHLHDNKGGYADLHLPLGAGTVDFPTAIRTLKKCGYDGTITLEVFTPDRHYLAYSRDLLRRLWDETETALFDMSRDQREPSRW